MRNGKIVGGETIGPLLKSMPKADADALRARLETLKRSEAKSRRQSSSPLPLWERVPEGRVRGSLRG